MIYKIIYKITIVIMVFLFTSCKPVDFRQKVIDESHEDFKGKVSVEILDKFPKTIKGENAYPIVIYPESLKHNYIYCGVFTVYNLSKTSFATEYKKIMNNKLYLGKIEKSECIQLKSFQSDINYLDCQKKYIKNKYIVPDYSASYDPLLKDDFGGEFEIVLIDRKIGKYLSEEYLKEDNLLPMEYKHGYSQGIFLDNKKSKIIYWLIIW